MNLKKFSMCCGIALCTAMIVAPVVADQTTPTKPKDSSKPMPSEKMPSDKMPAKPMEGMSPEMAKGMAAMEAYGALGEHHAHLKQWEGEWDITMKWWMAPGTPPVENKVTASSKMILDGHFLVEKVKGNVTMGEGVPPMPFEGVATMGYDNQKKMYFSQWMDNMMSGIMTEWGTCSQGGKVLTTEGDNYNPMNGKVCHSKSIATIVDANTRKLEMWGEDMSGKTYKAMELLYTRKK